MNTFLQGVIGSRNRNPYIYREDFEGTGTPFGWTWNGVGTASFDNTAVTSPSGGQNLWVAAGTNTNAGGAQKILPAPFPISTFGMYCQIRFGEFSKNINRNVWITNNFYFSLFNVAPSASCVYGNIPNLAINTWHHLWIEQTPTTGSLYQATTATKPGSPLVTGYGSFGNLSNMLCNFSRPGGYMIDKIRISHDPIGSNPI